MDICFAEQGPKSAGGRSQGEEKDKQEDRNKEEGKNPTVKNAPGQTPSITDPDTPLTGDTGNMEIGKTDLGAGPVGAGNETKLREE